MSTAAGALVFLWLGMVLAISFLEAPLKFRAPDVTLRIGLGIGRLVFRALNGVEALLAIVIVVLVIADRPGAAAIVGVVVTVAILVAQLAGVRPRLTKRSDQVLAGEDAPRSHAHYVYIGLEAAKVVALITTGTLLLNAG